MAELTPIIKQSFTNYAGAVLQSRALVDVRDCLKPSARQIFYCMYTDKFVHSKPFKKTLKAIGSAMRMYIHGDSSCEGVIMRAGQPFAMRYPLVEVEGSFGNLMDSGNWAAPRYTSSRLSDISNALFSDIDKETISEWRDNYDDTEQYPTVLPSVGFYNIVNGTMGIGIGAASSIPQYNINDVNKALITLLWNEDASFEEIYCIPDFATGAILINEEQVKESMKKGTGFACKLRSVVEFDSKERCFIVKEIPYSVYTNTICGELEAICNDEANPGIDRFNDLTAETPNIKIYLKKNANPDKVLKYLYKNTSLEYYYGINFTMLEDGRFPRVFTWKEALLSHVKHAIQVRRNAFEFDKKKIEKRLHIIDGLLIALANIDEVVKTIKSSASTSAASVALQKNFLLDAEQAKAILDMKLSRLAHLEVEKLVKEQTELQSELDKIIAILNDENLLKKEVETCFRAVMVKFGDARRTKVLNICGEDEEPTEIKSLQISLTNQNNIFLNEVSSLYTQKRGGVGNKLKLDKNEYVVSTQAITSNDTILFFTETGSYFHYAAGAIPVGELVPIESLFAIGDRENICAIASINKSTKKHIAFVTKEGLIKKSLLSEYNTKRAGSHRALNLDAGDRVVDVLFMDDEDIGVLTAQSNFLLTGTADIRPIGRVARGVKIIKLNEGDYVVSARAVPKNTKEIVSVSAAGLIKKTSFDEFAIQGRATKGAKLQRLTEKDLMGDFIPVVDEKELLIASNKACIKINLTDVASLSKGAQGSRSMKLAAGDKILKMAKF